MYNLIVRGEDERTGTAEVVRQALKFSNEVDEKLEPSEQEDVIEIRVHRIEHRQRVHQVEVDADSTCNLPNVTNNLQCVPMDPLNMITDYVQTRKRRYPRAGVSSASLQVSASRSCR